MVGIYFNIINDIICVVVVLGGFGGKVQYILQEFELLVYEYGISEDVYDYYLVYDGNDIVLFNVLSENFLIVYRRFQILLFEEY